MRRDRPPWALRRADDATADREMLPSKCSLALPPLRAWLDRRSCAAGPQAGSRVRSPPTCAVVGATRVREPGDGGQQQAPVEPRLAARNAWSNGWSGSGGSPGRTSKGRPGHLAVTQRHLERTQIHKAARRVDQQGIRLDRAKRSRIDHVAVVQGQRTVQADHQIVASASRPSTRRYPSPSSVPSGKYGS